MSTDRFTEINQMFEELKENHAKLDQYFHDLYPKLSADLAELLYLYEQYASQLTSLSLSLWKLTTEQAKEMERLAEKAWMYDGLSK